MLTGNPELETLNPGIEPLDLKASSLNPNVERSAGELTTEAKLKCETSKLKL